MLRLLVAAIVVDDDDTEHVMPAVAWKDNRRMQDALFTRCPSDFRTSVSSSSSSSSCSAAVAATLSHPVRRHDNKRRERRVMGLNDGDENDVDE